ncbi:MAG: hypothetical protein AB7V48_18315 [Sedimentibacter sp.]
MISNIFQLCIFSFIGSFILLYLLLKINIDDAIFTSRGKLSFLILFSIVGFISYKYFKNYNILVNYVLLVVLNIICFRRTITSSIIISTLVYVTFGIGDIIAGAILMSFPYIDIVAIQSNSFFSFLIYVLIFIIINIMIVTQKHGN